MNVEIEQIINDYNLIFEKLLGSMHILSSSVSDLEFKINNLNDRITTIEKGLNGGSYE